MPKEEPSFVPGATRAGQIAAAAPRGADARQRVRGIAGQLRPYYDVRAGFEPWRRVALLAWRARESSWTAH